MGAVRYRKAVQAAVGIVIHPGPVLTFLEDRHMQIGRQHIGPDRIPGLDAEIPQHGLIRVGRVEDISLNRRRRRIEYGSDIGNRLPDLAPIIKCLFRHSDLIDRKIVLFRKVETDDLGRYPQPLDGGRPGFTAVEQLEVLTAGIFINKARRRYGAEGIREVGR